MRKAETNRGSQGISLNVAYKKLQALYAERCTLEDEKLSNWELAHKHCERRSELAAINRKIDNTTHKINEILQQLAQCDKAHKVMNFAYNYIGSEIERLEKIANKWGNIETKEVSGNEYLNQKRRQIIQLNNWQTHISHYLINN